MFCRAWMALGIVLLTSFYFLQEDWESDIAESPMPGPFDVIEEKESKEAKEEREKREFLEAMRR